MAYGARREPFLVAEANAMSTGFSHSNFPAYDGQWRQPAWALVARGARMVEYFAREQVGTAVPASADAARDEPPRWCCTSTRIWAAGRR